MNEKSPPPAAGHSQREKFEQAARELETDQSEAAFDAIVKKIAKALPPKKVAGGL